jgi:gamma-glutamyltranspeptidase / glutathione hydrolase
VRRALLPWLLLCTVACARTGEGGEHATPPAQPSAAIATASAAPPAASAASATALPARAPVEPFAGGPRSVAGAHGLVVSVEANATRAGVKMLELGGNAVDAAVAVGFALAVTHSGAGNIGGGGFMLARPPQGPTVAIDFRENSPAALTRAAFDAMIAADARGPAAAGVPGTVAGLLLAHERFGKLERRQVLAPAIELASKGHRLSEREARVLAWSWPWLSRDAAFRRVFAGGKGPKRAGENLIQADLATVLERIAEQGAPGFYEGETARAMAGLQSRGGLISEADLNAYRAAVRTPLRARYRGVDVETMPPPSAGGAALLAGLRALESLKAHEQPAKSAGEAHLMLEVWRRAQAMRRLSIFDLDALSESDRSARLASFVDPARLLAVPVDPAHATPSSAIHPLYPDALRELEHTTHYSVTDGDGFVVSCTVTLSASFGAKVMVPGAGFVLNNAVASFGSVGDNQPAPSRRTTSSMAPTLLLDGDKPLAVLGTPGGDTIPSTLLQLVRHLVDHRLPLDAAIDAPRLHHGFVPDEARYEAAYKPAADVLKGLAQLGHKLRSRPLPIGDAKCLVLGEGVAFGYSDPREGGLALAAGPR